MTGLLMAVALVAGCGGDAPDDGENDEPSQQSENAQDADENTPSAEPSPSPTSEKEALKQELYDATVHFYETVAEAYMTGDVASVEQLRDPNNRSSGAFVQELRDMQQRGERTTSETNYEVDDFSIKRHGDEDTVDAFFTLSNDAGSIVDAQGDEAHSWEPGSSETKITFIREGSNWLVHRIADA